MSKCERTTANKSTLTANQEPETRNDSAAYHGLFFNPSDTWRAPVSSRAISTSSYCCHCSTVAERQNTSSSFAQRQIVELARDDGCAGIQHNGHNAVASASRIFL
jgi:hypothetical protein